MPFNDYAVTSGPIGASATNAVPAKGKSVLSKDKKASKDVILINPDMKQIMQEAKEKHMVMAYGRMNPPTTGHQALVNKMHEVAKEHGAGHVLIASHSQDAKKNPLSGEQKIKHLKRYFPDTHIELANKENPTFLQHAAKLNKAGATHLHMIAGSDRVDEYKQKLHQYNGEGEGKLYNFKHIEVHSAGQRDPDAEGTEGMSASKMREHAKSNNFKEFKKGVPKHVSSEHAKELFHDTRHGMGINEELVFERVISLQQRRARAIQMRRQKSKLVRARAISRMKLANPDQLKRRAYKQAKQNIRRRFAGARGAEYQTLGPSDKVSVDRQIDAKVKNIRALVQRILPRIRQADTRRLSSIRAGKAFVKGTSLTQFNSVELDMKKFNQLYESVFNKQDINEKFTQFAESVQSHIDAAKVAEKEGKMVRASLHKRVAAALRRNDKTTASGLVQDLRNLHDDR